MYVKNTLYMDPIRKGKKPTHEIQRPTLRNANEPNQRTASIPGEDGEASSPVVSLAVLAPSQPGDWTTRL